MLTMNLRTESLPLPGFTFRPSASIMPKPDASMPSPSRMNTVLPFSSSLSYTIVSGEILR